MDCFKRVIRRKYQYFLVPCLSSLSHIYISLSLLNLYRHCVHCAVHVYAVYWFSYLFSIYCVFQFIDRVIDKRSVRSQANNNYSIKRCTERLQIKWQMAKVQQNDFTLLCLLHNFSRSLLINMYLCMFHTSIPLQLI